MSGDHLQDAEPIADHSPEASGDALHPHQDDGATAESAAVETGSQADGAGDPPAGDPEERLLSLVARIAELQAENESLRDQSMRLRADFDNFRKRQSRDHEDLKLQITCSTLSEILPVVDNFDRARQHLNPQSDEAQSLHRSYQGLYKQLVEVFKQLGVSPMRVEGEPFDPNLHEAVLREESQEHGEDVVIEELQRGYHLNGRVLRHAMVKVSMGPGPQADQREQGG